VDGILMWGFWADRHWRGADAAIVDSDWTVNAAGRRYEALLAEWTTSAAGQADAEGRYGFRGFQGEYEITAVPAIGPGTTVQVAVEPGEGAQQHTVVVPLDIHDFDGDIDVDMTDYAHLQACFTEASSPIAPGCEDADLNGDAIVDTRDATLFARCLSGAGVEPDPACSAAP